MRVPKREIAVGVAGLCLLVAVVWYFRLATPVDVRGVRTADLQTYFYPSYAAFFGRLARGELLRWNPYQSCGYPWLGSLQTGFFYPPHVLYLVLPTYAALFSSTLLHVLLAAASTAAFARRLGFGYAAAAVGALLFVLRGMFAQWLAWPYLLEAVAWLPLGCLATHGLVFEGGGKWIAALAATLGMSWLAGGPQGTVFILYAWGTLLFALLVTHGRSIAAEVRVAIGFGVAIGLGTLAGMIALLPGRELAGVGLRAGGQLDLASMFPAGFGGTLESVLVSGGVAGFTAVGWSLVPFAVAARDARAVVWWAVGIIALTSCFSLGPTLPATFALYLGLPLLAWFRTPARVLVLAGFAFALLAAAGTDVLLRWVRDTRPARARDAVLLLPLAPTVYFFWEGPAIVGVLLGAVALAVAARARMDAQAPARALGVTIVALALVGVAPLPGLLPYDATAGARYHRRDALYERLAALQGDGRVWIAQDRLTDLFPRLATLYGVRSLFDYEPLLLERQNAYFSAVFPGLPNRKRRPAPAALDWISRPQDFAARAQLLDVAAVRWVVVPKGGRRYLRDAFEARGMRAVDDVEDFTILENPRALPRAYVVYRTEAAPAEPKLLDRLASPGFDPLRSAVVENLRPIGNPAASRGHGATIVIDEPERVEIDAQLAAAGMLVLADTYAPGWVATVDGAAAEIFPTNQLFRGVLVPPGRHRVRFEYPATSLLVGALGSLAGWTAIGLLWVGRDRRRRNGPGDTASKVPGGCPDGATAT